MRSNAWIYSLLIFLFLFFILSFVFRIIGAVVWVAVKFWYIWVLIFVIIYLVKLLKGEDPVKKYHNDGSDYIEAEYRVEGEDDDEK